jgi:hypothetical protein
MKFFRTALSDHKRNEEILEEKKVETADEKLRRYKSNWLRHVTRRRRRCKNNAELQTKWTKTTWKTFKETIRLSRNKSIKASLLTDDDDDDDDENVDFVYFRKKTRRQSKQVGVEVFVFDC